MVRYNMSYRLKLRENKIYGVRRLDGRLDISYWDKVNRLTKSLKESGLNVESHMGFPDGTISYIINGNSTDEVSFFLIKHSGDLDRVEITPI